MIFANSIFWWGAGFGIILFITICVLINWLMPIAMKRTYSKLQEARKAYEEKERQKRVWKNYYNSTFKP